MSGLQVGVLFSQEGFSAFYGVSQLRGTLLAIDEINRDGGIRGEILEPVFHDPKSEPDRYSVFANKLLIDDGVPVIFGCTSSFSRKAVMPWLERRNALLFYPTCYEGFEFSPNIIFTGSCPNQLHVELANYIANDGRRSLYLLGSDYIFPRESNRIMKDLFINGETNIIGERYIPLMCEKAEMAEVLDEIIAKKPDVILSTLIGQAAPLLYDGIHQRGLMPDEVTIASLTTGEIEVSFMEHLPAAGHVSAAPYFASIDSEENHVFTESFAQRYGPNVPIDACAEAAYFQVQLFAKAARTLDLFDLDRLREALPGVTVAAPQGLVRVDPDNNHTYLWPRIGLTDGRGGFQVVRTPSMPVKPDPYLVDYASTLVTV